MLRSKYIVLAFLLLTLSVPFSGQSQSNQNASTALPDAKAVLAFLNQTLAWYRHFPVEEQLATEPRDVLFLNDNRQMADHVVRLSFDFARAEVQNLAPIAVAQGSDQTDSSGQARYQSVLAKATQADQQVKQSQADVESLKKKLD